jgi:hypothetical protein
LPADIDEQNKMDSYSVVVTVNGNPSRKPDDKIHSIRLATGEHYVTFPENMREWLRSELWTAPIRTRFRYNSAKGCPVMVFGVWRTW